mgnify:FL=1
MDNKKIIPRLERYCTVCHLRLNYFSIIFPWSENALAGYDCMECFLKKEKGD